MLDFIIGFGCGLIIGGFITLVLIRRAFRLEPVHPLSWTCDEPGCKFRVSTNSEDPGFIMRVIEQHKDRHV